MKPKKKTDINMLYFSLLSICFGNEAQIWNFSPFLLPNAQHIHSLIHITIYRDMDMYGICLVEWIICPTLSTDGVAIPAAYTYIHTYISIVLLLKTTVNFNSAKRVIKNIIIMEWNGIIKKNCEEFNVLVFVWCVCVCLYESTTNALWCMNQCFCFYVIVKELFTYKLCIVMEKIIEQHTRVNSKEGLIHV